MADDAQTEDLSEETQREEDQPERLRVHSLARVLGTTSKRVIDALTKLDGRPRSAHSAVGQEEAERVREALANSADEPEPAGDSVDADEPESRLILETAGNAANEPADYLPLFVAPQPVTSPYETDDDDDDDDDGSDTDEEQADRPAARRRRRGRRGRGRGRGEQGGDDVGSDGDSDTDMQGDEESGDESDDDNGDEDTTGSDGANRRRRRRRRRKSGPGDDNENGAAPDDPPNTVVHERAGRRPDKADTDRDNGEIQGISGSTRLEAKRQRRRDGRDAGRRRPPILSESEFLARREAVERTMVVRDKVRAEPPHEGARYTQIAVLEDGVVVEHFVTSAASASLVGNIYLGIVQNVLPSMEAAFVDIGRGRNGVLYAGEVNWEAAGLGGANRKIEQALKPGDYVVVQVSKDPVGHKGARLTTQVSLAGRYLVYVPGASSTGISRKLPDTERQRLKEILREVVPANAGVIIRTASEGVKEEDIRTDVNRLQERWNQIEAKATEIKEKAAGAAVALYEEPDVLVKVIRDLFNEDFSGLIVSGGDAWNTINEYVNSVAPELVPRLTKYEPAAPDGPDVFAVYRIDEQLTKAMDRKVWLPSGGTLVIDRTEAMTVIDVNTGKFTGSGGNLEQTVTRNNLEAAEEIVRQLRLRDIGGIVVIDFIDMVLESNRDLVLRRLTEALARDRTRHQVSEVTSLGLVQLTRKRLGTGLIEAFSTSCPHCGGRGIILHGDPVDSTTSTAGRKSESGGRRGKRGKKGGRSDDVTVAKVPAHPAGEHPMFKAMAAANGKHEADDTDGEDEEKKPAEEVAELDPEAIREAVVEIADEDLEDEDLDDTDEDSEDSEDDEDEIDLDSDDEDVDDDIEVIDREDGEDSDDYSDEDSDAEDEDSEDLDEDESDEQESDEELDIREPQPVTAPAGRHRRRAAARPAGPPIHES
ncbi:MAG TPA: translation initiation factor IF-2 N-terminal domain-containing protein [Mycobacterium sp.]|nr:translation initiation factor IF-2 N-terminal domain-containing protein [Mycobacterium sp.]